MIPHLDRPFTAIGLALALLALTSGTARATDTCPGGIDPQFVLTAHGAEFLSQVLTLDFNFHAMHDGTEMVRQWHWDLRTNQVTVSSRAEDGSITLLLAFESPPPADASEEILRADRQFLNDRFWLLFPHRLAWDTGVTLSIECDPPPSPIAGEQLPRVTALYGAEGGYTPGDAYDFWVRSDGSIAEWGYRRGNVAESRIGLRFDGYVSLGPMLLSLLRTNTSGTPQVWFDEVSMTTADGIVTPVPIPRE